MNVLRETALPLFKRAEHQTRGGDEFHATGVKALVCRGFVADSIEPASRRIRYRHAHQFR
jgi:hypothetical protein